MPLEGADAMRVGAPIARPTAVLCVGQNYAAHAAESGDPVPRLPIVFLKYPNTVVGSFDDIEAPVDAVAVDWEVELGVVIGRRAHRLDADADALDENVCARARRVGPRGAVLMVEDVWGRHRPQG